MKIYKLDIDTSKPAFQKLAVPTGAKYGIAISATDGSRKFSNLSCTIDDGNVIEQTKLLEDGSALFEMQSSIAGQDRIAKVNITNQPLTISGGSIKNTTTIPKTFNFEITVPAGIYDSDSIDFFSWMETTPTTIPTMTIFVKNPATAKVYAEDANGLHQLKQLIVTLGHPEKLPTPHAVDTTQIVQADWEKLVVAEDSVFLVSQMIFGNQTVNFGDTKLGKAFGPQTVKVLIDEQKNAVPDYEIEDVPDYSDMEVGNISADTISLSGVAYVPTNLTIDGTTYTVLAAPAETPAETTDE